MIRSAVVPEELTVLCSLAAGKVVLELGSYCGGSTVAMAKVAHRVHAVDWHLGDESAGAEDTLREYFSNLESEDVRHAVVSHVGRFEDVIPLFRPGSFDLAFLDGAHTFEATMQQIDMALSVLKPQGVIAFHDYGSGFGGVRQAIDERFEDVRVARTLAWTTI